MTKAASGCYGIGLDGLHDARRYMSNVADGLPVYTVSTATQGRTRVAEILTMYAAQLQLSDRESAVSIDRTLRSVRFSTVRTYSDEQLLHPFFASSAAAIGYWLDRDSFHGGAADIGGRAWTFIGDKGDGKSTMVAQLSGAGYRIVADDLLMVERGGVHAGPGFVDLRADAAQHLGVGRDLGHVGTRTRARLDVPSARPWTPLGGWIVLAWGPRVELSPVPIERRIGLLYHHRSVRLAPRTPARFVDYAALPFFELRRPKAWSATDEVLEVVSQLG